MINQRIEEVISKFESFATWEDRYREIIQMGKGLEGMDEKYRVEANEVKGCQSKLWLFATFDGKKVHYHADSDASIVKGIVSLLLKVYSDAPPSQILNTKPDFIDTIGLRQHLSMSRANGLNSLVKQIFMYAMAFSTQEQK